MNKKALLSEYRSTQVRVRDLRWRLEDIAYISFCLVMVFSFALHLRSLLPAPTKPVDGSMTAGGIISPVWASSSTTIPGLLSPSLSPTPRPETVDDLVTKYADRYGSSIDEKAKIKVMLHFLLYRESRYGRDTGCGDGGKACGPAQFWQETYVALRTEMITKGLTTELGSRENMHDAIQTTAYALSTGRAVAWGPILRKEIKL